MSLRRRAIIYSLQLLSAFLINLPAIAQEQFRGDYIMEDGRLYAVLQPLRDRDQKCANLDSSAMIPLRAKILKQTIFGEALIPNKFGYVYWIANSDGPHEVFFASYIIRNCVITEIRSDLREFYGEKRLRTAEEYYRNTVKENLE